MDIFISWSGQRSRAIAEAIREWLPKIMPSVKPWMSQTDINKGSRWNPDISQNLDTAKAGIFCLTPSNLTSASILFEAGAISKSVSESRVYTVLSDVEIADLRWPLAQFQATSLRKDDVSKMLRDINKDLARLGEPFSPDDTLEEAFDLWWPKLEERLSKLPTDTARVTPARTEKDLLEEVLELVRDQARSSAGRQDEISFVAQKQAEGLRHERDIRQVETHALFTEMKEFLVNRDRLLLGTLHRRLGGTVPTLEELKIKVCAALESNRLSSAVDVMLEGRWSRRDGDVVVETDLSRAMLPVVVNSEAHKIALQAMADIGEFSTLTVLPAKTLIQRTLSTPR